MKRSEMIQKIIEEVEVMRGVDMGYYVYPEDTQIAERILKVIEDNGMVPSGRMKYDPGHFPGDAFSYRTNEWDDETH